MIIERDELCMKKSFNLEWEHIHSRQEWGRYPSEAVVRFVARNFYHTEREKKKILDFGCGAGANTWFLAREGFDVYAFDGSKSAVKRAQSYLKNEGYDSVKFAVMDALELTYQEDFFDCIVDNVCICANLYSYIKEMYKNVYRILKPGGKFFSSCFGSKTDGYGTGKMLEEGTYEDIESGVLKGRAVIHLFSKEEFSRTIEEAGFKNIQIDHMLYTDQGIQVEQFLCQMEK